MQWQLQGFKQAFGRESRSGSTGQGVLWGAPPKKRRSRSRLVNAHALFVAGGLVVLVLSGLDLPLAFFLLVAIVVGVTLIFANRRFAESRATLGRESSNGPRPATGGRTVRWSRIGLAVVLSFVAAECATMTIYNGQITQRIAADIDRRFAATTEGLQQSVTDLARQAEDLYPAASRTDDQDPSVVMYRQQAADLRAELAQYRPRPCPAVGPCSAWRRTRTRLRAELNAQLTALGPLLQGALGSARDARLRSSAQLTEVNAKLTARRMELSGQDQDRAAARGQVSTADRVSALVAIRGWEQSVLVPLVLFLVAFVVDYAFLTTIAPKGI